MTEQETNYFLDGVTAKQDLIESIESLRTELASAMAPILVAKPKQPERDDISFLLSRDYLTPGQKVILMWMETNSSVLEWTNFSIQNIADGTSMSRKHVRESLLKLNGMHVVRHNCDTNKWYMPEDFAMELSAYESTYAADHLDEFLDEINKNMEL